MIAVMQTEFGKGQGNCFSACLASVLEVPIESVPNFCAHWMERDWLKAADEWCQREHGVALLMIELPSSVPGLADELLARPIVCLVGGKGPRGLDHEVVWNGVTQSWHDPYPAGGGITRPYHDIIYLIPCGENSLSRKVAEKGKA